jgi:hypothetical protein
MATRRELKNAIRQRYQESSDRRERRQILAEFVRVTGYHRKHALRVVNHAPTASSARQRERVYDEAVHQALAVLWEAADRICGKRLRVLLPVRPLNCLAKSCKPLDNQEPVAIDRPTLNRLITNRRYEVNTARLFASLRKETP